MDFLWGLKIFFFCRKNQIRYVSRDDTVTFIHQCILLLCLSKLNTAAYMVTGELCYNWIAHLKYSSANCRELVQIFKSVRLLAKIRVVVLIFYYWVKIGLKKRQLSHDDEKDWPLAVLAVLVNLPPPNSGQTANRDFSAEYARSTRMY